MDTKDWAKNEIKIAIKNLGDDNDSKYVKGCYESAYKVFERLCNADLSGISFYVTRDILERLCDGYPLTQIEDVEDIWDDITWDADKGKTYQCKRMSSLFKDVLPDGTVKYNDIKRNYCVNVNSNIPYHSGLVSNIIDEMYPITMPYMPDGKIRVECEELLFNEKNGDFDTVAVFTAKLPNGDIVDINRYFKKDDEVESEWKEISKEEYDTRRIISKIV